MPAGKESRIGVMTALRHKDFALLWSGQSVSLAGNGIYTVALPLEVLRLTGSAVDLSIVVAARTIPAVLLLLVGGVAADRVSRRNLMLICDCICAVCVLFAALLIANHDINLWELGALSALFGLASAFFKPASSAIIPDILPNDLLVSASSLTSVSQSLAQYLLGPVTGGLIVALDGSGWAFALDGASFAVSAACLAAMSPVSETAKTREKSPADGIRAGIAYCRSQSWLWWSMIGFGVANFACIAPLAILQPLLVQKVFHAGPVALGVLYGASGAGGIAASVYAGRRPPPRRPIRAVWGTSALAGLAVAALGVAPVFWLAVALVGVAWAGVTYSNLQWFPVMQTLVPSKMLGRASSIDWLFSLALAPLGTVAGGLAVSLIGVRPTLALGGLATAACTFIVFIPGVTDPDNARVEPARPSGLDVVGGG